MRIKRLICLAAILFIYLNVIQANCNPGGTTTAIGFQAFYDPQSTDGQTTITATVGPLSGGECNVFNNTDSERLVYFK